MPIQEVWDPDQQKFITVEGKDGAIKVTSTGTGGADLATEPTQLQVAAYAAALASVVTNSPGAIGTDPGLNVKVSSSSTLPVQVLNNPTAFAQPSSGVEGVVNYTVGLAPAIPVGEEGDANPVFVKGVASIAGTVDQGKANPDEKWNVTDADTQTAIAAVQAAIETLGASASIADIVSRLDLDAVTQAAILAELEAQGISLGTVIGHLAAIETSSATTATNTGATTAAVTSLEAEVADDATTTDVQAVETAVAAVETELQDKATEATLATRASEATVATIASNTETIATQVTAINATGAKDASVDGLEGLVGRRGTPSDSTGAPSSAAAVSGIIFSGANTLRSIDAINTNAGIKYTLMVFNATALPSNGATPVFRLPLPGGGSAHWDRGKAFSTGAYWAISTTEATLTVSGMANAVVDAEYGGT